MRLTLIFIAFITLGCLAEENIEEFTEKVLSRLNNVYDRLQSAEDIIKGLIEGNFFYRSLALAGLCSGLVVRLNSQEMLSPSLPQTLRLF